MNSRSHYVQDPTLWHTSLTANNRTYKLVVNPKQHDTVSAKFQNE